MTLPDQEFNGARTHISKSTTGTGGGKTPYKVTDKERTRNSDLENLNDELNNIKASQPKDAYGGMLGINTAVTKKKDKEMDEIAEL